MDFAQTWSNLCTPAQLYAIIAFITIIVSVFQKQYNGVIVQAIFAVIWTLVLGWICNKGWTGLSWFLVLLPVIITLIAIFALMGAFFTVKEAVEETVEGAQKAAVAQGSDMASKEFFY